MFSVNSFQFFVLKSLDLDPDPQTLVKEFPPVSCMQAFLNDWDKVVAAAAGASLLALGYFTAKRATGTPNLPPPPNTGYLLSLASCLMNLSFLARFLECEVHRVGRVLSFFSSRWNWDSPTPSFTPPPTPLVLGGGHTRLRERGWVSPNSDEGTYTVVLCIYLHVVMRLLRQKTQFISLVIENFI